MTVFYAPPVGPADKPAGMRVGFTVGKALGGAVQRNRMKRRLRELVRLDEAPRDLGVDIVMNPKRSLLTADFAELRNEVAKAFVTIEKSLTRERPRT